MAVVHAQTHGVFIVWGRVWGGTSQQVASFADPGLVPPQTARAAAFALLSCLQFDQFPTFLTDRRLWRSLQGCSASTIGSEPPNLFADVASYGSIPIAARLSGTRGTIRYSGEHFLKMEGHFLLDFLYHQHTDW